MNWSKSIFVLIAAIFLVLSVNAGMFLLTQNDVLTEQREWPINNFLNEQRSWQTSHITSEIYSPYGIAIGDVDNDGVNELIVGSTRNDMQGKAITMVYAWDGTSWINKYSFTSNKANHISIGDVTNDGLNEIVITDTSHKFIQVFKYSAGEWNEIMYELVDRNPMRTVIADVTNNGLNEILTVHHREETVTVFEWNGTTWNKHTFRIGPVDTLYSIGLTVEDATNDGLNEIIITNWRNNTVYLFNWDGETWIKTNQIQTERGPTQTLVADTTGDGLNEVLVINFDHNTFSEFKWNGTEWNKINYNTAKAPKEIFFADVDGNGEKEIIILNVESGPQIDNLIEIFKNVGGTWTSVNQIQETPMRMYAGMNVGDMKNNGKSEIAVTNNILNRVTIFDWGTKSNPTIINNKQLLQKK